MSDVQQHPNTEQHAKALAHRLQSLIDELNVLVRDGKSLHKEARTLIDQAQTAVVLDKIIHTP